MELSSQLGGTPARNVWGGVSWNVSFKNCMVQLFDMYTGGRGTISLQYNKKKKNNSQMNGHARRRLYVMEMEDIYVRMTTAEIKSNTVILNI